MLQNKTINIIFTSLLKLLKIFSSKLIQLELTKLASENEFFPNSLKKDIVVILLIQLELTFVLGLTVSIFDANPGTKVIETIRLKITEIDIEMAISLKS